MLRARVDYQTQQQALIRDQNAHDKDKLALARAVGLPLEQKFELADRLPFAPLEGIQPDEALKVAYATRKDLQALQQQVKSSGTEPQGGYGRAVSEHLVQRRLRRHRSYPWTLARHL